MNTATNASDHVGNGLACANCHLDGGRHPDSAPMWAAWGQYPAYRSKNDRINTMEDRVMGCFTYSMNAQHSPSGEPPPHGDDIYRDLQEFGPRPHGSHRAGAQPRGPQGRRRLSRIAAPCTRGLRPEAC